MKINNNGVIQDLKIKASDTLPVGSIVDYDGVTVPSGWEKVEDTGVILIKENTDINNIIDTGVYYLSNSYTYTNLPGTSVNGWLVVFENTGTDTRTVKQIWYRQGTLDTNDWNTYERTRNENGTWSQWHRFITTDGNGDTPVSGQLLLNSAGFSTSDNDGYHTDQWGNFWHDATTTSHYWSLNKNSGAVTHKFYWETGEVTHTGNVTTNGNFYAIKTSGEPDLALTRSDYSNSARLYAAASNDGCLTFGVAATKGITNAGAKIDLSPVDFTPRSNGGLMLGNGSYKWGQIYSTSGSINTSDRRLKEEIEEFDSKYEDLFDDLKPVKYRFKGKEHDRIHSGFISQDVEESLEKFGLTANGFAGFCKDQKYVREVEYNDEGKEIRNEKVPVFDENGNEEYEYSLRYEEFIALNTWQIQKLKKENEELKERLARLEEKLDA